MTELKYSHKFAIISSYMDCNPNGDPDRDNKPRTASSNSDLGMISSLRMKTDLRETWRNRGKKILITADTVLKGIFERDVKEIEQTIGTIPSDKSQRKEAFAKAMSDKYFDVKTFGQVMTTNGDLHNSIGCVAINHGRSVEPITICSDSITRKCAATDEGKKENSRNANMGRFHRVDFATYVHTGEIFVKKARQKNFTEEDWSFFKDSVAHMFHENYTASKSGREINVFIDLSIPENEGINLSTFRRAIKIDRKDANKIPESIFDYNIKIDHEFLSKSFSWYKPEMIEMKTFL